MTPQNTIPPNKDRITIRLKAPVAARLERVTKISRRTRTSVLDECLEAQLPVLERQYRKLNQLSKAA